MEEFTRSPEYGATVECTPRVSKVSFGDGYESRWRDGLNTALNVWNATFKDTPDNINAMYDWLKEKEGVDAFKWTAPDGNTGAFVCDSVSRAFHSIGWNTITVTFRQVPESIA